MAIDITPFFKGALIVHAILIAYFTVSFLWVDVLPVLTRNCKFDPYAPKPVWFYSYSAMRGLFPMITFSVLTLIIGALGVWTKSASILRHMKLTIIAETILCIISAVNMAVLLGQFWGEVYQADYKAQGCPTLNASVTNLYASLWILLAFKAPLLILLEAYLKSLGDDLSFLDYIFAWCFHIRNCTKYGRQGISFTSSFIKMHARQRLSKSVRVSQKNDTLFREVELGNRMFGALSLDLFKENIALKYERHPNDIIRLTKNGNVLISDDGDVARISHGDVVVVDFADLAGQLQEVNSVMLEDVNIDTRIEM